MLTLNFSFYARGLKGLPGAYTCSNWIVRLSVCLFLIPSHLQKVQYLKFGWWYSNQTWTVCLSRVPHTSQTSHAHLTWLLLGAFVFHKHMLSLLCPWTFLLSRSNVVINSSELLYKRTVMDFKTCTCVVISVMSKSARLKDLTDKISFGLTKN